LFWTCTSPPVSGGSPVVEHQSINQPSIITFASLPYLLGES
jgi:hypothetical protein